MSQFLALCRTKPLRAIIKASRVSSPVHQRRQLGIRRAPPRLILGEQLGRRSPAELILEIDIGERLAAVVANGEARGLLLDRPRRREAVCAALGLFAAGVQRL